MKTEILKLLTFLCMVVVLGTQELLQGRWSVHEPEGLNPKKGDSN